ncbi:hypothetical protein BST95_09285 [Halioglobus japonicus]|nr:hypothetical protein BST95_09285 [Halioglobus japonicus]
MQIEQDSIHRWHACSGGMVSIDGQRAHAVCYGLASASNLEQDGRLACRLIGGRYLDELEKRDDEWRIIKRRYIADGAREFDNGLEELVTSGFAVNVLNILKPGHEAYRPL